MLDDDEGWWSRTVRYGDVVYSARCPQCARFVKTDKSITRHPDYGDLEKPNATCAKHGRVITPFLAWAHDCCEA